MIVEQEADGVNICVITNKILNDDVIVVSRLINVIIYFCILLHASPCHYGFNYYDEEEEYATATTRVLRWTR